MIGKAGARLDIAKLDVLCQERKLQRLQNIRNDFNLELDEIAGKWIIHSKPVTRPYGVQREGEAYDVWHHILHQVPDPPEIKKLWEASGMFRDIIRGKYIATILPEIVNLISDKRSQYWEYPEVPEWLGEDYKEKSDRKFRMTTFLNLRLLSKQCKMSVEDICHSEKCNNRPNFDLWDMEDLRRIRQRLEEDPSIAESQFPGFVVSVREYNGQENIEQFREAITDFLSLAGHKIQTFDYYPVREAVRDTYNRLREWAFLLPNMEDFYFDLQENAEDAPELEEIQPFPKLPLLRSIEEGGACRGILSSSFMRCMLEGCQGIHELRIFEEDIERDHSTQMLETLSSLTSLQLFPYSSLLDHRNLPWKLKKLNFGHPNGWDFDFRMTVASCSLFPFLKQFEETLEHLEFHMVDFFNCHSHCYLDMKNLKILKVKLHESFKNLNFLLYAEKLEILKIKVGRDDYITTENECRKIISGSFLEKSIWDVFPYLKWFRLRTVDYFVWNRDVRGTQLEEFRQAGVPQVF